jgi:hypothetical protein
MRTSSFYKKQNTIANYYLVNKPSGTLRNVQTKVKSVYKSNKKTAYTNRTCGNKNRRYTTINNAELYLKVDKLSFACKCLLPVADRVADSVPTSVSTSVFSVFNNRAMLLENRFKKEIKIKNLG